MPVRYDLRADTAEPGFYWVRVMGTDVAGWQVAECYAEGRWSLLGMPRYGRHPHADMIRELGPRVAPPVKPCDWVGGPCPHACPLEPDGCPNVHSCEA